VEQVCRNHERHAPALAVAFPALERLQEDGVIRLKGKVVEVESDARLLVRAVASAFDAYLGTSGRTHSRAV
jgi:oxygen-independent coproporphyrinogen-3 oxidase